MARPSRPATLEATLSLASAAYPVALRDLPDPPPALRVRGALPSAAPAVAIVGTRRADPEGLAFSERLAADLARAGVVVVSGGAEGIDAAAHRGAMAAGGRTVAVLPTGFAPPYPRRHSSLFAEIVGAGGALATEVEDGLPAAPHTFLRRNRLVAALASAVVVVQAPERSGALSTARHARALGRALFAVPAAPWDLRGAGCVRLLEDGERVCTSARSVLSVCALGTPETTPETGVVRPKASDFDGMDEDARRVGEALGSRPRHVDELSRALRLPAPRVQRALLSLLLHGLAEERGPARYVGLRSVVH